MSVGAMALAAGVAALTVLLVGGPLGGLAALRRLKGEIINPDLPERYRGKAGTPTMGGLLILAGFCVGALVAGGWRIGGVLVVTLAFGAIGLLDDMLAQLRGRSLGLKARQKLALQVAAAVIFTKWVMSAEHTLTVGWPGVHMWELGWLYLLFGTLFMVTMSNATNLADGMDGLAAGLTLLGAAALAIVGSVVAGVTPAAKEAPVAAMALAGACAGFLGFNRSPALVFMGDTGSLALGACLAAVSMLTGTELPLLVIGAVFLAELLSVVIQVISFKTTGRRVFRMSPLHHHFDRCGWPERKVVTAFWIAGGVAAALGLLLIPRP